MCLYKPRQAGNMVSWDIENSWEYGLTRWDLNQVLVIVHLNQALVYLVNERLLATYLNLNFYCNYHKREITDINGVPLHNA